MSKSIYSLLVIFIISISLTYGQKPMSPIGKWKIIFVDMGVYHDYKKNITLIDENYLKTLKGQPDSAFVITLATKMVERYSNYIMHFTDDARLLETNNGKIVNEKATYKIDTKNKLVKIRKNLSKNELEQEMKFDFQNENLRLTMDLPSFPEQKFVYILERIK